MPRGPIFKVGTTALRPGCSRLPKQEDYDCKNATIVFLNGLIIATLCPRQAGSFFSTTHYNVTIFCGPPPISFGMTFVICPIKEML
jgi:hypothetical protein